MSEDLNGVGQGFLDETRTMGQGEELRRGGVIEGIKVGIGDGEFEGVGCGQAVVIKKGEIVVETEVDEQVKSGIESGLVAVGESESEIFNVSGGTGVGGNYDEVVLEMEVDRVENGADDVALGTANGVFEVVGDQVKSGTKSGFVVVGVESESFNAGGGAGVGGNYDEVVPEVEVDRVENDADDVAGTANGVFEVVDGQVKSGTESGFVAVGVESESFNAGGRAGVGGNYDEVVPEMEIDRAGNDADGVAVGTVNEVFEVVDVTCSGGISMGRNQYDPTAFEHFNSEGLNLVVDLGDLFSAEKELRPRYVPNEDFNSDGVNLSANSNKHCVYVNMEGVNLAGDLSGAGKECKDERLAFEKDGDHVTEHLYGNDNVFGEPMHATDVPDERVNGTGRSKKSDAKEISIEARMENYAVSGHHDMGVTNNQNTFFEEQMTGPCSDDEDGNKSNLVALRPKVRSENDQTEKEGEYYLSDLVWGKVKGHPWWPGQIFEPSAASTKAEKYFKKGTYLVAYFGDRTFAWNEPDCIKPFHTHYARMEKLSKLEDFCEAVDCALEEVSRRVEYGLSCSCLPTDQLTKMENQTCVNAGIRQKSIRRYGIRKGASSFAPTELLQDIELLAADPFHEIEKLRFVNVRAQLLAYNHWKGFNHLPDIVEFNGLMDGDADFQTLGKKSSVHMYDKGEGRTRRSVQDVSPLKYKHISDVASDDSSIMVDGETELVRKRGRKKGSISSSKKFKANKSVCSDLMRCSQKVLPHWDQKESSSRLSKRARKVSVQLCEQSTALEPGQESSKSGRGNVGNNSIDAGNMPLPEEILSKLCLAAASPMEGYGFMKSFISFLSKYRNTICLEQHSNGGKRKRSSVEQIDKKYPKPEAVEMYEFEGIEDSYWTDRIIESNPEEQELLEPDCQLGIVIPPNVAGEVESGAENTAEVGENSEAYTPTELILKFSDLESVPSITELNKIFSRYGPLNESQTVVFSKSKRAKVVFKKRSHAETAFSSSGKFSIFGHSLLGYCLKANTSSARNRKAAKSANAK